jgi:hypothetical protein
MSRRLTQVAVIFVIVVAAAQFFRPELTNPTTDPSRSIGADIGTASGLVAVLDRSCSECHSNSTVRSWYWQIAPVSWVVARSVTEGRKAVNFSEWAAYSAEQQRDLLAASCQDATAGRMPGLYTLLNSDAKLSSADIETICAAARQTEAQAATASELQRRRER